jgi:transposase
VYHVDPQAPQAATAVYPDELKKEAVQMLLDGHTASSVAHHLGVGHTSLLYRWKAEILGQERRAASALDVRVRQLEQQLRRTERERDILKKPWPFSARGTEAGLSGNRALRGAGLCRDGGVCTCFPTAWPPSTLMASLPKRWPSGRDPGKLQSDEVSLVYRFLTFTTSVVPYNATAAVPSNQSGRLLVGFRMRSISATHARTL